MSLSSIDTLAPSITKTQTSTKYNNDGTNPCKDNCDKQCASTPCYSWSWFGASILWFIIFIVLFWLIYYSLKPSFVFQVDSTQVDTAKVLLGAVISALILIIIVWLIKVVINKMSKKK